MEKQGDHYFFSYNSGLQNQNVYYRVKRRNTYKIDYDNLEDEAVPFLDPNKFSADGIASLAGMSWSPDHKYLAYMIQRGGSDWTTIKVRRAGDGKDLKHDVLRWVKFSGISWTKDGLGFFYSRFDSPAQNSGKGSMD